MVMWYYKVAIQNNTIKHEINKHIGDSNELQQCQTSLFEHYYSYVFKQR